jgi:hypothetical protein
VCHSYCITDNFPDSVCNQREVPIEYNNNVYSDFFYYPNPIEHFKSIKTATAHLKTDLPDVVVTKKDYQYCKKQINKNPTFPYSKIETDR